MSLFQSPPCLYPLTHENPSLQLTERTVPLVCSTPEKGEKGEKEEMRRMGWVGGDGGGKEIGCSHSWEWGSLFAFIEKWETLISLLLGEAFERKQP